MQERYYLSSSHNLIAVEKGHVYPNDTLQNNVYTRGAAALERFIREDVLAQDPTPSFYSCTQEYTIPDTDDRLTRRGFIGAGKLEDYCAGIVFRHEQTLSGPTADRLELLRHTHTHTGQLFMLYSDSQRRVDAILAQAEKSAAPVTEVRDEYGVVHRLWVIAEPERVAAIQEAMADQKLVIADGHHRYETALTYRNERRAQAGHVKPDAPYERAMMTFVNTCSEGLTILPTHRVAGNLQDFSWTGVRRHLDPWFIAETFPFSNDLAEGDACAEFRARLAEARGQHAIGVYPSAEPQKRAFYVLRPRPGANLAQLLPNVSPLQRELDVVLLHEGILKPALGITPQVVTSEKNLAYVRDSCEAVDAVDSKAAQVAFLLNACDVEQVMRIATSGEVMPQKSTDFYPKLLSGIAMYRLDS
jgi:uncharacterized protein (DUF1015 family)